MKKAEIEKCFNATKQEVLKKFQNSLEETIKKELMKFADENNKINSMDLAAFAYTNALTTSVKVNSEITLNTLIKMFADD
ncbi:MAG: hypothetical protein PHX62_08475 [Bacilli bacterium]|nr:hypothetical protein [Bacilli bacterium]